ncbi:MAG: argininosuccinate lyase [Deltaproteobacteria bacterium]|nr:argininosuccinate lyase [Deltaproteobacteria bacterium]
MWGGRFSAGTEARVQAYTCSLDVDRRLYRQDIEGSKAHARMLARQGVLTADEAETLIRGLDEVAGEIEAGTFVWREDLEDVHMNVEARLTELVGPVGRKLHTGRSRNDQVALDFRLFVSDALSQWSLGLVGLVEVLVARADEHRGTIMPGYTHLQPAQPVSLAHHLLAYARMFMRDHGRVRDCDRRTRVSPLGAAALAGTTYPLDPESVAHDLGFDDVFANSMDAVSDRDFVLESIFCAATIMAHLSRLCEEIILWANPNFGFVRLPDGYATGSSIMPQKKNPDVAELMRGKTGRVYGDLTAMLTILKGLPMTYNRDLQEDKAPFMDAHDTVSASLVLMAGMVSELGFVPERMRSALCSGFLNATELADYLVGRGLPFRDAHHVTGRAVARAEELGCGLEDLSLAELQYFSESIGEDVFTFLDYDNAVARRETPGGTGPVSVGRQIEAVRAWVRRYNVKEDGK